MMYMGRDKVRGGDIFRIYSAYMQNMQDMQNMQNLQTKPSQTYQTKPTKPNLPTKPTKPNLAYQHGSVVPLAMFYEDIQILTQLIYCIRSAQRLEQTSDPSTS